MGMGWKNCLTLLFWSLTPDVSAQQAAFSGSELLRRCEESSSELQKLLCDLYIKGSVDQLLFEQRIMVDRALPPQTICIPNAVTGAQITSIVKRHLNNHPEMLHHSAAWFVRYSLRDAFPC